MKKTLIINLRRIGDVYTTGHLVNSMVKDENTSVSLLVYKESSNAAHNLKNISQIYEIDRKEIITLKTNKLFSDGFALEQLFNQLEVIKKQKWDEIVNYSNDVVSAYICSYLRTSTEKTVGISFNNERNVITNSNWEILFNDVLPVVKHAPMHFVDCYHKMTNTLLAQEGEKLLTNPEYNTVAFSNLSAIRSTNSNAKIIGIQLKTSEKAKDIPEETIVELVSLLKSNSEFYPVLLIAPFDDEKNYANHINKKFSNSLVIIEADLSAVASVLTNLDLLITPDTVIKHIADLTETPVLEISLGHAPFLKQGTYLTGSLVLTDTIASRNFIKTENKAATKSNITAHDILSSVLFYFARTKNIKPLLSPNVTLYTCNFDQLGASYSVVAGTVDPRAEIHRFMTRQLINLSYDQSESTPAHFSNMNEYNSHALATWIVDEKSNLTEVTKDLLGTLRSLLQCLENRKSSKEFIHNLGKLMAHAEVSSFVQIPVLMFKTKIESINAKTFEENAKEVENLLYELKANIQKALLCIKNLEESITTQKKDDFMNRIPSQVTN